MISMKHYTALGKPQGIHYQQLTDVAWIESYWLYYQIAYRVYTIVYSELNKCYYIQLQV